MDDSEGVAIPGFKHVRLHPSVLHDLKAMGPEAAQEAWDYFAELDDMIDKHGIGIIDQMSEPYDEDDLDDGDLLSGYGEIVEA